MASLTRYDPARLFVTWGGLPLSGFAPGTFLTIRRDDPVWRSVKGTNGELRRLRQKSKSGTVDLTLRHTASFNQALGALVKIDELTASMIAPLVIIDKLNASGSASVDAYIAAFPDLTYSKSEPDITWTFVCETIDMSYPGLSPEVVKSFILGIFS